MNYSFYAWLAPVEVTIVTVLLLQEFGISFLAGLAAATLIGVVQKLFAHMTGKLRQASFFHNSVKFVSPIE